MTTVDRINWQLVPPLTSSNLRDVVYAGGRFVTVGDGGVIMTSVDGLSWHHRNCGSSDDLSGVAFGKGRYVLVGKRSNYTVLFSSADLDSWSTFDPATVTPDLAYLNGSCVMFGNDRFIVPASSDKSLTSNDGLNWAVMASDLDEDYVSSGYFANGKFYVAVGGPSVLSSTDGAAWSVLPPPAYNPGPIEDLIVSGSSMVISKNNGFAYTTNGGSRWTWVWASNAGFGPDGCGGLGFDGTRFAIMFNDGTSRFVQSGQWPSFVTLAERTHWQGVCHGNGSFVAVGHVNSSSISGVIRSSANGIHWVERFKGGNYLKDICYGNGLFVAVGEKHPSPDAVILTSTDLVTWTERSNPATFDLKSIIYADGKFVAVGGQYEQAVIITSTNGILWESRASNALGPLADISYGMGRFVAVGSRESGNFGDMVGSADGIIWEPLGGELPRGFGDSPARPFSFVCHGNGAFIAGGGDGYLYRSTDGILWDEFLAEQTLEDDWNAIFFHEGRFLATGGRFSDKLFTSADGLSWVPEFHPVGHYNGITAANGLWVAVGDNDHIATRRLATPPAGPSGLLSDSTDGQSIDVSWTAPDDARGFIIFQRPAGSLKWTRLPGVLTGSSQETSITGLVSGTDYEIAIQSILPDGASEFSIFSQSVNSQLELWRRLHFGSTADSGNGRDLFDFDLDGLPNLIEYAVGTDPKSADANDGANTSVTYVPASFSNSRVHAEVRFICDASMGSLNYHVEVSNNFTDWTRIAESVGGARTTELDYNAIITDNYHSSSHSARRIVTVEYNWYPTRVTNTKNAFIRFGVEKMASAPAE